MWRQQNVLLHFKNVPLESSHTFAHCNLCILLIYLIKTHFISCTHSTLQSRLYTVYPLQVAWYHVVYNKAGCVTFQKWSCWLCNTMKAQVKSRRTLPVYRSLCPSFTTSKMVNCCVVRLGYMLTEYVCRTNALHSPWGCWSALFHQELQPVLPVARCDVSSIDGLTVIREKDKVLLVDKQVGTLCIRPTYNVDHCSV